MQQAQPLLQPSKWRMGSWFVASLVFMAAALLVQHIYPGSVVAVTLYKAHLMVLGGWGGYWLDRALFPRERALIDGQTAYATYWQKADGQTYDGKPLPFRRLTSGCKKWRCLASGDLVASACGPVNIADLKCLLPWRNPNGSGEMPPVKIFWRHAKGLTAYFRLDRPKTACRTSGRGENSVHPISGRIERLNGRPLGHLSS